MSKGKKLKRQLVKRVLSTGCTRRTAGLLLGLSLSTISRHSKTYPRIYPPDPKLAEEAAELIKKGIPFDRAVKLLGADPELVFKLLNQ
mgnify:CR=1 FL=1